MVEDVRDRQIRDEIYGFVRFDSVDAGIDELVRGAEVADIAIDDSVGRGLHRI